MFGGQVRSGTHDCSVVGSEICFTVADECFGDSEVSQLDLALFGDEDIAGLDVHVDHALAMRSIECSCDVDGDASCLVGGYWPFASQDVGKGPSFDVLHDDERGPLMLALVEYPDDVLMVEAGDDLGLSTQSSHELLILGQCRTEDLHRNRSVE